MKTRYWLYPLCAVIPALICALVCALGFHFAWIYSACYSAVAALFGFVAARFFYNLATGCKSVDFYASEVMAMFGVAFSLVFVTSESLAVFELFTGLAVASAVVAVGLSVKAVKDSPVVYTDTFSRLKASLKFAFVGDDVNGEPDINRPLCVIDGVPRSADEAEALGYGSKAAVAIEYIKKILK